ncbi:MAG: Uma2 family endonuclease [Sinobacteraceae bacterium]|nr:Uma2 family endonuclease [Nevskiaceae bacterium]
MALPLRDSQRHTYAEYLTWPDEPRYELIDGIAYIKERAETRLHQEVVGETLCQIANVLQGTSCRVYHGPLDVCLPKAGEADDQIDTVVQPDVLIVCDRRKLDDHGVRGAPDWVAEVLSPATASHDRILKRAAYERAGLRELWLIQPIDRTLDIYRLEEDGRYGPATILQLKGQTPISAVPGVSVDWDLLLPYLE